jgi:hypothetical protein
LVVGYFDLSFGGHLDFLGGNGPGWRSKKSKLQRVMKLRFFDFSIFAAQNRQALTVRRDRWQSGPKPKSEDLLPSGEIQDGYAVPVTCTLPWGDLLRVVSKGLRIVH